MGHVQLSQITKEQVNHAELFNQLLVSDLYMDLYKNKHMKKHITLW